MSRTAIVLVNWNSWRDCTECLSALVGSGALREADVWLVDNASSDGSVPRIQQWCAAPEVDPAWRRFDGVVHAAPGQPIACRIWPANGQPAPDAATSGPCVTLVPTGANLGFAGGNNAGIAAAGLQRYSHFWLLNTDTVVHHQALQALLARAQAAPQPGIVGSTLLYYDRPACVQASGGGRLALPGLGMSHIGEGSAAAELPRSAADLAAVEAEMAYVVGASMLVTARFIREVGPMCEDYFLYFEELDWALRSRGRFALGYASDSRVFHKVGGSSTQSGGDLAFTLLVRNQLRFAARFLPERVPAVQRRLALEFVRHLARQRWAAARIVGRALLDSRRLVASAAVAGRTP